MARISAESEGVLAARATAARVHGVQSHPFKYVPGFVYILVLFIAGKLIFPDPRAILVHWNGYHLSWVEVLLVGAAMMAMAEQLRVSHPGIDNTIEAILMAAIAGVAPQVPIRRLERDEIPTHQLRDVAGDFHIYFHDVAPRCARLSARARSYFSRCSRARRSRSSNA